MSEPQTPPPAADPKPDADKGKDKGKGLDKFITPDLEAQRKKAEKEMFDANKLDPPAVDDKELKEEIEKLQKEQYKMKREQKLGELSALKPEVAEEFKSSKLSDIETALKVAKVVAPKFPVNREAPVPEAAPRGGFLNRRTGKWE